MSRRENTDHALVAGVAPELRAQVASRRAASIAQRKGFTLVELMVVIVIIGLLATIVAINVLPSQDRAMVGKAQADIAVLEQAVETYRLDNLTFPTDQQGLAALKTPPADLAQPARYRQGGYIRRLPKDPWGADYQYRRQSAHGGAFDIWSFGADGKTGGEGDDADIGNWQG
ncbi:type II secretion system major pseudopilin GspG [Brevundimonas sp.]|uniref:type II secretion system major pseudopilin GspG n=2 Tax=Brevundimonas sp. TaxID=1871086 RepID=UPI004034A2E5